MQAQKILTVKCSFEDEIRRVVFSDDMREYQGFRAAVFGLFGLQGQDKEAPQRFRLKYIDDEKDLITVSSQAELDTALQMVDKATMILRVVVVDTATPDPCSSDPLQVAAVAEALANCQIATAQHPFKQWRQQMKLERHVHQQQVRQLRQQQRKEKWHQQKLEQNEATMPILADVAAEAPTAATTVGDHAPVVATTTATEPQTCTSTSATIATATAPAQQQHLEQKEQRWLLKQQQKEEWQKRKEELKKELWEQRQRQRELKQQLHQCEAKQHVGQNKLQQIQIHEHQQQQQQVVQERQQEQVQQLRQRQHEQMKLMRQRQQQQILLLRQRQQEQFSAMHKPVQQQQPPTSAGTTTTATTAATATTTAVVQPTSQ